MVCLLATLLGVAACVAVSQVAGAVLWRPLPVLNLGQLFYLRWHARQPPNLRAYSGWAGCDRGSWQYSGCSFPRSFFERLRAAGVAGGQFFAVAGPERIPLSVTGVVRRFGRVEFVSGGYFGTLGVGALWGRPLLPRDDRAGAPPVMEISARFWARAFARSPRAIGSIVVAGTVPFRVVGIARPRFVGLDPGFADAAWIPLRYDRVSAPAGARFSAASRWGLWVFARATPPVVAKVRGVFSAWATQGSAAAFAPGDRAAADLVPAGRGLGVVRSRTRRPLTLLFILAAVLLLLGAAAAANFHLASLGGRDGELAMRAALGCPPLRLAWEAARSGLELLAAGGLAGAAAGAAAAPALLAAVTGGFAIPPRLSPRFGVREAALALAALGVALLVPTVVGLVWMRGLRPAENLYGRILRPRAGLSFRRGLLVMEVAFCALLLVAAGLLGQTVWRLSRAPVGFDPAHVLEVDAAFGNGVARPDPRRLRTVLAAIRSLPGVISAGAVQDAPFGGSSEITSARLGKTTIITAFDRVAPGYFATQRLPLLAGRGLAGDSRYRDPEQASPPMLYLPLTGNQAVLLARSRGNTATQLARMRRVLRRTAPASLVRVVTTEERDLRRTYFQSRMARALATWGAALALLIACAGVYSVVALEAVLGRRDAAIRLAMGASRASMAWELLSRTLLWTGVGTGAGLLLAACTCRSLSSLLFQVPALDPITFAIVAICLPGAGLLAALYPASRAGRVHPMTQLRAD